MNKISIKNISLLLICFCFNLYPNLSIAQKHKDHSHKKHNHKITNAIALIIPTQGNEVQGTVKFTSVEGGIKVEVNISGLTPGKHGFHVHQWGDLTSSDGKSTGGHFNPTNHSHSAQDAEHRHIGDLGNIEANKKGIVNISFIDPKIKLNGKHSIIGRGIIVHAKPDDLVSQPTGAAGARVGQGVIGIAPKP